MATEAVRISPTAANLTWRGSLNVAQALLDYSAKLLVALVVVPIMVTGLGRTLFGVWEMLGRLAGYMESADGRPTQALRLVISNQQASHDQEAKRRWIGGAVAVWLIFLPLWAASGTLLIWLAPAITKVPADLHTPVRLACALLVGVVLLGTLASVPESVLRGMNLGYRRMGLQAGLSLLGGALMAGAVYAGLGLAGVAGAQVALAALTGVCFWLLVRKYVPWFGAARPRSDEVKSILGMSLWIAAGNLLSKLLSASDVLVLGMVTSASSVTTYVLTGYAARVALNLHTLATDAVMPGLAGVIGERTYERAASLRRELLALTWLFATTAGATILLWNRSFLRLWVGAENYAGPWIDLLIVLIAVQAAFIRCDSYVIDAALQPRLRVRVGALAAVLTVGLSLLLTHYLGMAGLCLGVLAGRATQTLWYPMVVRSCLERQPGLAPGTLVRLLVVMALVLAASAYLGRLVLLEDWLTWGVAMAFTLGLVASLALAVGLPPELRAAVLARLGEIGRRFGATGKGSSGS